MAAASRTRRPSGSTSLPMPSPGIAAIWYCTVIWSSSFSSLCCIFRIGCTDVPVLAGAKTCDEQTHCNRQQQNQRYFPRARRIAQDAEEDGARRGEQVSDGLGHTRQRGGVPGV